MAMDNKDAYKVGVEEQKTAPTLKELGHRARSHVYMSVQGKGLCSLSRGLPYRLLYRLPRNLQCIKPWI